MSSSQNFRSLSAEDFNEKVKQGYKIIDIRRADEWEYYGVIEGSYKITFFDEMGGYDIDTFLAAFTQVVTDKEQPFILVCAHARRTKAVGRLLAFELKYTNVYELDGGINWGWLDRGYKTLK